MRITASQLERLLECPASFSYEKMFRPDAVHKGENAEHGTNVHKAIEIALGGGDRDEAYKAEIDFALDYVFKLGSLVSTEVAVMVNFSRSPGPEASSVINTKNREYGKLEYPIVCGTADAFISDNGTITDVVDFKTGDSSADAHMNAQLFFFAVFAYYECNGHIPTLHLLNVSNGKATAYRPKEEELIAFARAVVSAAEAAEGGKDAPKPGHHCKYCPVKSTCPVAVRAITNSFSNKMKARDAADAAMLVFLAEKAVEDARGRLNDWVRENGDLELPDGSTYSLTRSHRDSIDPYVAKDLLIEKGYDPEDFFKISISKKDVQEKTKEGEYEGILGELASRGGIRTAEFDTFRVKRRKTSTDNWLRRIGPGGSNGGTGDKRDVADKQSSSDKEQHNE